MLTDKVKRTRRGGWQTVYVESNCSICGRAFQAAHNANGHLTATCSKECRLNRHIGTTINGMLLVERAPDRKFVGECSRCQRRVTLPLQGFKKYHRRGCRFCDDRDRLSQNWKGRVVNGWRIIDILPRRKGLAMFLVACPKCGRESHKSQQAMTNTQSCRSCQTNGLRGHARRLAALYKLPPDLTFPAVKVWLVMAALGVPATHATIAEAANYSVVGFGRGWRQLKDHGLVSLMRRGHNRLFFLSTRSLDLMKAVANEEEHARNSILEGDSESGRNRNASPQPSAHCL